MEQKKTKKGRITEEEFNKLPKDKQNEILAKRKARENEIKMKANTDLNDLLESDSDRELASKFNKVYSFVRKSLVVLNAKKQSGENRQELINTTKEMLTKAITLLE